MVVGDPPGMPSARRREVLAEMTANTAQAYEGLLVALGREWREPFDAMSVAMLVSSLVEGAVTRRIGVPTVETPDDMIGWAVCALLPLFTRSVDDTDDATAWVAANTPDWAPPA